MTLQAPTDGEPGITDMNGLADDLRTAYGDHLMSPRNIDATLEQCVATWYDGSGGVVVGASAAPVVGTDGGPALTGQVALVLSWRIARSYRGGHPRSYLAGWSQTSLDTAVKWSDDLIGTMQDAGEAFLGAVNGTELGVSGHVTLGTLSWFVAGGSELVPREYRDTPVFFPIGSVVAKPGVATQRRRLGSNNN
jgi:hypothetical protein